MKIATRQYFLVVNYLLYISISMQGASIQYWENSASNFNVSIFYHNGLCHAVHAGHVTIFSPGGKFCPVSNFT